MSSKAELRARVLAARRALPDAEIAAARAAICRHVLARWYAAAGGWRRVAAYQPLRTEPGSVELLDALVARGVEVIVPVLLPDRDLDWTAWPAPDRPLGTAAIATADAVVVPALAVDERGVRLGRGGGSYDRALARVPPATTVVALLYDGERVARLPREDWDIPVTAVAAPSGWHPVAP